jgi:hypothetical protein
MKKLLVGAALCALFAAPALSAEPSQVTTEPIRLNLTQMDGVSAGACEFGFCSQFNSTWQSATAVAVGGSSFFSAFSSNAAAAATNVNETKQEID